MRLFCFLLCLQLSAINLFDYYERPGGIYLLTEPRSGTHWLQASIQFLTNRQTLPFEIDRLRKEYRLDKFGLNILGVKIDPGKPALFRTHCEKGMRLALGDFKAFSKEHKLIFLTRNYKEVFPRRVGLYTGSKRWSANLLRYRFILEDYVKKLEFFDEWEEENRLIVYYEDLVDNCDGEMARILAFLEEGNDRFSLYKAKKEALIKKSYAHYLTYAAKTTKTGGKKKTFHSLQLENETRQVINAIIVDLNPQIAQKYLSRYL